MARVLFLDPYHGPSHRALSTALREHSRHDVRLLTLPPRKWKWRMRGSALAFEPHLSALSGPPDVLVATDMLNLPELLALARRRLAPPPTVISYFHENQLTYPMPVLDERDFHFGLVNIYTALASDRVVFNSRFHLEEFLAAIPGTLRLMPDFRPDDAAGRIRARSSVLGVPLDLPEPPPSGGAPDAPLILWSHRWEEDKDPGTFFAAIRRLDRLGAPFRIVVLGQSFRGRPDCFESARRDLAHRIEHWGWLDSRAEYVRMVARCHVVVSTARHEFFGLAVREAIALGCWPLLPRRVVYPELVGGRSAHLYETEDDLVSRLADLLSGPTPSAPHDLRDEMRALDAPRVVARWDAWFDAAAASA